ncbi:hypothetical protein BDW16_3566 [Sphingomonas koreensis]|nr:hypothetical protein BDW16_3566 [Sphingomonas koreensis]
MPSGRMNRARPSRHDDPSGPSTLDDRNRKAGAARQRRSKGHRGGKLILRDHTRPGDRPQGGLPPDGQPVCGLPLAGILRAACRSEMANRRHSPSVDQDAKPATLAGAGRACRRHEGARCPLWWARGRKSGDTGGWRKRRPPFPLESGGNPPPPGDPVALCHCHRRTRAYLRRHDDVRTQRSRLPAPRLSGRRLPVFRLQDAAGRSVRRALQPEDISS